MLSEQYKNINKISRVFKALGNETRLKTVLLVNETTRPLHIKAVANELKIDYAAIYRHVKDLAENDLLEIYEVGRSRVLSLKNKELIQNMIEIANKIIQ
jgi:DNA-binding transcriptional ArsR family regulator